jgi:mannose-6-phosphate isomerase-like protein (cupin superfamily)
MKCNQQHIEKPWGWESIIQANEHYAFKRIHIAPGKRLSLQYHKEKMETIYCLSEEAIVWTKRSENDTEAKKITLRYGEAFHIMPNQIHRFAAGFYPVDLMEVSTPQLNDVVRLEDDYNRIETTKETE